MTRATMRPRGRQRDGGRNEFERDPAESGIGHLDGLAEQFGWRSGFVTDWLTEVCNVVPLRR